MTNLLIGIGGLVLGAVGVIIGQKAREEARRSKDRFTWTEVEDGINSLIQQIEGSYDPDLIVSSSGGSVGIIANLYITRSNRFVPLYIGVSRRALPTMPFASTPIYSARYKTSRWETYLPHNLDKSNAQRVLVLEDAVVTGQSMIAIRDVLHKQGFKDDQIRTAALVVTQLAARANEQPDYWWKLVDSHEFYFPWGPSSGKSF